METSRSTGFPTVMLILNASCVAVLWFGAYRVDAGEMQIGAPGQLANRGGGRDHRRLGVEDLDDPLGADRRARDHHRDERRHHHRHQDLHQVVEERGQRADLHLPRVDPVRAEPQHGHAGRVQDQHHRREDHRLQPADAQRRVGEIVVGGAEPAGLRGLADERADDPDAGQLLAQHAVDLVDALLHQAEQRHHPGHDQPDADGQRGHADQQQPGQADVLAQRHDHARHAHDRRGDEHRADHGHQQLHLLDVVGGAGDQRGRAEPGDLAGGVLADPVEDRRAHVAAERHRGARAEVDRADGADDLHHRHGQHPAARGHDVAGVAARDAEVDDVGVEAGQVERGDRADQLQHDHRGELTPVRP
jgi:hypothetical protein